MRRPESSPGTSSPTIAAARSVAMRGSPPYLRAWTASRAPPSSHTADRARPNAAGHSAHSRQPPRSEEHTSELQSPYDLVCRLLLEKKKNKPVEAIHTLYPNQRTNTRAYTSQLR